MINILSTRLKKLETIAGAAEKPAPKIIRLVSSVEEEADIMREAVALGYDTSPDSADIMIIRLVGGKGDER